LVTAGLDQSALGRDWVLAAQHALSDPVGATVPFSETGYFPPERPSAAAFRLPLVRGRRLSVDVTFVAAVMPTVLFVDLFEIVDNLPPRHVAAMEAEETALNYDVERDGTYVLRIQPELLRGGRFTLIERTQSPLTFPVPSQTSHGIGSAFGAVRDAGTREHEGVDIFAPRGTPVVAVVDGTARPDTNGLGGNVVWLNSQRGGPRFYYAHLDRWEVGGRTRVRAGDILGYVGNTGNARTTAPHLHFGIYDHGALDPMPFLRADDPEPAVPDASRAPLGDLGRVTPVRVPLREGASRATRAKQELPRGTVVRVLGTADRSYRVALPDSTVGYVDATAIAILRTPLRKVRAVTETTLRESPLPTSPVVTTAPVGAEIDVLGDFEQFSLVRIGNQDALWMEKTAR